MARSATSITAQKTSPRSGAKRPAKQAAKASAKRGVKAPAASVSRSTLAMAAKKALAVVAKAASKKSEPKGKAPKAVPAKFAGAKKNAAPAKVVAAKAAAAPMKGGKGAKGATPPAPMPPAAKKSAAPEIAAKPAGKGKGKGPGAAKAAAATAMLANGRAAVAYGRGAHIEESVCREVACEGLSTSAGYCRMHYIKNWKKIKRKELILKEGKLNQYIEELVAKYPDKYIEAIRHDLANDKEFAKVIYDLDLDESVDEFTEEGGENMDAVIDTIKRDFEDEGEGGF